MVEIELKHITKRFGEVIAADDINLKIDDDQADQVYEGQASEKLQAFAEDISVYEKAL